ncbi:MAG: hypothetical protein K2G46_05215, partial [Bacteroidales bacterium]|nr:hypothetical protein [Bacteroidales bacterium]
HTARDITKKDLPPTKNRPSTSPKTPVGGYVHHAPTWSKDTFFLVVFKKKTTFAVLKIRVKRIYKP